MSKVKFPKRKTKTRETRSVLKLEESVLINFDSLHYNCSPGITLSEWRQSGSQISILAGFRAICDTSFEIATSKGMLETFNGYPKGCKFPIIEALSNEKAWATIRVAGSQIPRLAGFLNKKTFHLVFLDFNHQFSPSRKK